MGVSCRRITFLPPRSTTTTVAGMEGPIPSLALRLQSTSAMTSYVKIAGLVTLSIAMSFVAPQGLFAEDPAEASRQALEDCLRKIAARAQISFHTPSADGGSGGSFANMTISHLMSWPVTAYGFFYLSSPSATSVALTGVGIETGRNGTNPIEVVVVVYSDSISVSHNN